MYRVQKIPANLDSSYLLVVCYLTFSEELKENGLNQTLTFPVPINPLWFVWMR